jgi:hypothetical protein
MIRCKTAALQENVYVMLSCGTASFLCGSGTKQKLYPPTQYMTDQS